MTHYEFTTQSSACVVIIILMVLVTPFIIYGQGNNTEADNITSKTQENTDEFWAVNVGNIISAIAAIIAAVGLFYNVIQMRNNQTNFNSQLNLTKTQFLDQMRINEKITRGGTWLTFREMISKYDDIHKKLRQGEWSKSYNGPATNEEWAQVDAYMGLFEHCNLLLNDKILDLETFKKVYDYRIDNILNNDVIKRQKLQEKGEYWQDFISLCRKIDRGEKLPDKYRDSIKSDKPELDVYLQVAQNPIFTGNDQEINIVVYNKNYRDKKIFDAKVTGMVTYPSGRFVSLEDDNTNKEGQLSYSWKIGIEIGKYTIDLNIEATDYRSKSVTESFEAKHIS
jgi:hypothetical protein